MSTSVEMRQAIVDRAAEVFRELGFAQASMEQITARVGKSKSTIYAHFPSKEALFLACTRPAIVNEHQSLLATLEEPAPDVETVLRRFGRRALAMAYSPDVMAARRLTYAEAHRFGIGEAAYANGFLPTQAHLGAFIECAMEAGQLRRGHGLAAALQLLALLEAELLQRLLYWDINVDEVLELDGKADRALCAFMAVHAPAEQLAYTSGLNQAKRTDHWKCYEN